MALTPEEISNLTLADVEAIARRYEGAVRTIREAQAMLGGVTVASATSFQLSPSAPPRPPSPAVQWTPAEMAERAKLKAQFAKGELPEDIESAMGVEQ